MDFIYLDHSATTPLDHRVKNKLAPLASALNYNPSAIYQPGQVAAEQLAYARRMIADKLGVKSAELYFTSSASESNNLLVKGLAFSAPKAPAKILISPTEHSSTIKAAEFLKQYLGVDLITIPADKKGSIDLAAFKRLLSPDVLLVAVTFGCSEIGTVQDISQIGAICQAGKIHFHLDAAQAADFFELKPAKLNCDSLSLSSHKVYGPIGIAALYIREGVKITPLIHGGAQEQNLRAGTQNVFGARAMAEALSLAHNKSETHRICKLTKDLRLELISQFPQLQFTGEPEKRLPFHISFILPGIASERALMMLDLANIAASAGSACNIGQSYPSPTLLKLGYSPDQAKCALRLSLGRTNTSLQIDQFLTRFAKIMKKLYP